MKTVLGVDAASTYVAAANLLVRLQWSNNDVRAVHVLEALSYVTPLGPHAYYQSVNEHSEEVTREFLGDACRTLEEHHIKTTPVVLIGSAHAKLLDYADQIGADLIAVGSQRLGKWGSLFAGSVTRALSISSAQTILVGKGEAKPEGPITAVLATDFSEYCDQAIDKLILMWPKGIEKVWVVNAHWTDLSMLEAALRESHLEPKDLYDWVVNKIERRAAEVAAKIRALGVEVETRLSQEEPRDAIARAMDDSDADLLIMGARGHGLRERITVGSVAMHQVMVEPYSVLVVRV